MSRLVRPQNHPDAFVRVGLALNTLETHERPGIRTVMPTPPDFRVSLGLVTPFEDEETIVDDDIGSRIGEPWKVILYNDDIHTFDEVILQLQKALGCGPQRAEKIAFEAHSRGKAIAYDGEFEDCFRVAGVLREIQLIVEIEG